MESMMAYDDDDVGYDEIGADEMDAILGYDEVGAKARQRVAAYRKRLPGPPASTSRAPGAQRLARKRVPLGLGSFTFDDGTGTVHVFEVEPQRDYQGERLILNVSKSTGAEDTGVVVTSIKIGDIEQMPTSEGMPADAFARDAVGAELDLSTCKGGTKMQVELQLSGPALGSTDTIVCEAGFYGAVVGQ